MFGVISPLRSFLTLHYRCLDRITGFVVHTGFGNESFESITRCRLLVKIITYVFVKTIFVRI